MTTMGTATGASASALATVSLLHAEDGEWDDGLVDDFA